MSDKSDNNGRERDLKPGGADGPSIRRSPDEQYGDCVKEFRARDYAAARDCFESWVKTHPDDAEARHQLARVLMHLNERLDLAESHIRKALELLPANRGRYLATYGELLVHAGRYQDALGVLEETLVADIDPDPGGVIRYVAENNLSLARKKLKAVDAMGGSARPSRDLAGTGREAARAAGKGGMFIIQSAAVHLLALLLLSILSGMHGRPVEQEDLTYVDVAPPAVQEQAGTAETGGGGGGGGAESAGALPGPIARLLGIKGPGRATEEARAVEGLSGSAAESERSAEARKETAGLESQRAADNLQAKLDTARADAGLETPRPSMTVPEDVTRPEGLDIDTGGAASSASREAAVREMAERAPEGAVRGGPAGSAARESAGRQTASGRKAASELQAGNAGMETPRYTGGGKKDTSIEDVASLRPDLNKDFMPGRSPLDIDAGLSAGGAATGGAAAGAESARSLGRSDTGPAGAKIVSSAAGTGERAGASGAKGVTTLERAETAAAPAAPVPGGSARASDIQDLRASSEVYVPAVTGGRPDLGIDVPSPSETSGGTSAATGTAGTPSALTAPSSMGERAATAPVSASVARAGGSSGTGGGYAPSVTGSKRVGGVSSAAPGDTLATPSAPTAAGRPGSPGIGSVSPGRSGPDISSVAVGTGGGGLGDLAVSAAGRGGTGGKGSSSTGGKGSGKGGAGTERIASVSGPGRGEASGVAPGSAGAAAGATGGSGQRKAGGQSGGKGFAAESLGRPLGEGGDKYRSASGKEARPSPGEKYASLGPGDERKGRPGMGRGPRVRIITPASGKTEQMAQTISGTVSGVRVDKATLAVNNDSRVISVENGKFNASVALFEGRNIVTVMAFDRDGNVGKDFVTLDYKTPESAMAVKIIEPRDGQVYDLSDKSTIMVRGTVADRSVRRAKLVLNGNPKDVVVENGRFEQEVALANEQNTLFVEATGPDGKPSTSGEVSFSTVNIKPKDMMVILTWDKPHADMDLHIIGPNGGHTYYKNPDKYSSDEAIADGELEQDAKDNYGPEVFTMEKAEPGIYTIKSNYYYSGGDGDAHATVTVILYGDNPARRIVRVFGPHLQTDTKTGEDMWVVAKLKMPEGIFLEE